MVRLGSVALLALSLPVAALGSPPAGSTAETERSFHLPKPHHRFESDTNFGRTEVAPNATFGFGMFGLKYEKSHLQPATGREIDTRKQRRAAVGFSLKF